MEPLTHLLITWCGVLVAVLAAQKTRLTPVLWFLFVGAVLVNVGALPTQTDPFIRGFAEIGIMFALGFEEDTASLIPQIILNQEAFITLMAAAFWLNLSVPLTIAWWKPRLSRAPTTGQLP